MAAKLVPSPRGWPIIGTLADILAAGGAARLHEYVDSRHRELGPIYREKIGPITGVFISSPDYMRRVFAMEGRYPAHIIPESWSLYNKTYGQERGLLFMEGERWQHFRKLLNPIILKPETSVIEQAVTVAAEDLISTWEEKGSLRDLEHELYKWSLESILAVLLGAESYRKHRSLFSHLVVNLSRGLHGIFTESAKLSLIPAELAQRFRLPPWKRFVTIVQSSFNTAGILIEEMKKYNSTGLLQQINLTGMKPSDVNRIVIDLILAAGDTTAYTTQWLLHLLAKHPDIQQKLYEGLNEVSIAGNQLLKGVLRETLRLFPVAPFITRYMPNQVEIDGYYLEKGDLVIMSLYTSGRDETSFPQPLQFQPERWLRNERGYHNICNPQASLPFAMGSRSCIGRKIAEYQIATTVAMILKKFNVISMNTSDVHIKLHLIAVPSKPIQLKLQRRSDK